MNEKAKSIGSIVLSISLFCLALAISYLAYELNLWRKDIPEILQLTDTTLGKIAPSINNITEMGKLVPPILEEVAETREVVNKTLEESKAIREQMPVILKDIKSITQQVGKTADQLPETIAPVLSEVAKVRELMPSVLEEVRKTNVTVEKVTFEVRETREALPGIMDRADQLLLSAKDLGEEAGKGAVTGFIGGIIMTPFNVVGGLGKGVAALLSTQDREHLTDGDTKLMGRKLIELANNGKVGQVVTWKNTESSNSGKITLMEKYQNDNQECRQAKIEIFIREKEPQTVFIRGCQQPNGKWIATEGGALPVK